MSVLIPILFQSAAGKGLHQFAIEEIMLRYAYPRLDVNVSTGLNHLLKAPFCVHPKSGKVCVPFNPKTVDKFDPSSIPTLSQLVDEVRVFDEKEKSFAAASGAGKATVPSAELPPQVKDVDEAMDTSTDETEKCAEDRNASPEVVTGADGETVPMDESLPQTESGVGEQQTDGAAGKEVSASDDVPSSEPSDGNWTKETPGEKVGAVEVKKLKAEQEAENAATDNGQVILDYKKTSMYKGILVFETFLRKLKIARNEPSGDMEGDFTLDD